MVGRMVHHVEKDVFNVIGISPSLTVFIFHPLVKVIGIGNDLKGCPLVIVMDIFPVLHRLFLPNRKVRLLLQYPLVPDVMRIQDMAKKANTIFRDLFHGMELPYQLFVAVEIVIEELLQESLHTSYLMVNV
jgi:hypothetical protein